MWLLESLATAQFTLLLPSFPLQAIPSTLYPGRVTMPRRTLCFFQRDIEILKSTEKRSSPPALEFWNPKVLYMIPWSVAFLKGLDYNMKYPPEMEMWDVEGLFGERHSLNK